MWRKIRALMLNYREIISYLVVGGLTTAVSLAVYYGCTLTFLDPRIGLQLQIANVLSWIAAVAFAYFTNRRFVFRSQNANRLMEAASFVLSRVATLRLDMGLMYLLVTLLGMDDRIVKLFVQAAVIVGNYVLSKLVVFRKG